MHSGAMSKQRIFSPEYEEFLVPESLHSNLLKKAKCNLVHNTSIIRQYRRKQQPIDRSLEPEQLWDHLNGKPNRNHFGNGGFEQSEPPMASRSRADSIVRFADEEQGLKSCARGSNLPGTAGSTGGNLKQISYIGQHHRTATPLSALSEGSHRSTFSDMSGDLGTTRPNLSQKDRVPRPPIGPSKDGNSVQNVSTASLEQWLQGVPPEKDPFSSNTKMAPNASETDKFSDRCSSQLASSLSFEEHLPLFNKELSEEERFAMDYGDFDGEEDDQNHVKPKELKQLSRSGQRQENPLSTNTDDELSILLGSGSTTNTSYSGDPP